MSISSLHTRRKVFFNAYERYLAISSAENLMEARLALTQYVTVYKSWEVKMAGEWMSPLSDKIELAEHRGVIDLAVMAGVRPVTL